MLQTPQAKFCPACHQRNELGASECAYCGASLDIVEELRKTTEKIQGKTVALPQIEKRLGELKHASAPAKGAAVYVAGIREPVAQAEQDEFYLGRKDETETELLIDLTPYDATGKGVSRRHAVVRRGSDGYEITDLNSTNGTWMNDQRLVPDQAYSIASGVPIRLGHLFIYIIINPG